MLLRPRYDVFILYPLTSADVAPVLLLLASLHPLLSPNEGWLLEGLEGLILHDWPGIYAAHARVQPLEGLLVVRHCVGLILCLLHP